MCGRTCLTLTPDEICKACGKEGKKLEWRNEPNLGRKYEGHVENKGFNTCPQDITPVLVSSEHFNDEEAETPENIDTKREFEEVVVPMLWGVIPRWHKGDYRKHGLTTNNCRLEGIQNSRLYKPLLQKGNRCVVLCEGFYEWQTVTGAKSSDRKVYYIYFPQEKGIKIEDKSTWNDISHIKLFKCAGLFDVWYDEDDNTMYNYTIITFESDKTLAWLHHRTPAVLETNQQVEDWLDYKRVPEKEALKLLKPPKNLTWYEVSKSVNNSRNKSGDLNRPLTKEKTPKSKLMQNWLVKKEKSPKKEPVGKRRSDAVDDENKIDEKKPKLE